MITLTLSNGMPTTIGDEDLALVLPYRWHADVREGLTYAVAVVRVASRKRKIYMHRLITGGPRDVRIDHIDGNGLNNVRTNLRPSTNTENARNTRLARNNTSGFKGVYWYRRDGCWRAQIMVDRRCLHLGYFATAEQAAEAYDAAAVRYFGAFARTNASLRAEAMTT